MLTDSQSAEKKAEEQVKTNSVYYQDIQKVIVAGDQTAMGIFSPRN